MRPWKDSVHIYMGVCVCVRPLNENGTGTHILNIHYLDRLRDRPIETLESRHVPCFSFWNSLHPPQPATGKGCGKQLYISIPINGITPVDNLMLQQNNDELTKCGKYGSAWSMGSITRQRS